MVGLWTVLKVLVVREWIMLDLPHPWGPTSITFRSTGSVMLAGPTMTVLIVLCVDSAVLIVDYSHLEHTSTRFLYHRVLVKLIRNLESTKTFWYPPLLFLFRSFDQVSNEQNHDEYISAKSSPKPGEQRDWRGAWLFLEIFRVDGERKWGQECLELLYKFTKKFQKDVFLWNTCMPHICQ